MPIKAQKSTLKTKKKALSRQELQIGDRSPSFSLPATRVGKVINSEFKGKPYILYFYPKDNTSGCTLEACAFQEALPDLTKSGAMVIGISKDNFVSHEKFAKKYKLLFPLASDEYGDVCEKFGVWKQKSMYGRNYMGIERSTFLIDAKGTIKGIWRKVSVPGHVEEIKKAISLL